MENKNLNTAVKDEKENKEVKEIKTPVINDETGEVIGEPDKVLLPFTCNIAHRSGSSSSDSYYSFSYSIYTDDGFDLPITFQLLPDEVSIVNLGSDNFLKKIPVKTSRLVNCKGAFYLGRNEDDSVYCMALVQLPGGVNKAIRFNRNQNAFITKCFVKNKQLFLHAIELKDGIRSTIKNPLVFSKSRAKSIDELYDEFND